MYEYYSASHDVNSDKELIEVINKVSSNNLEDKKLGVKDLLNEVVYAGKDKYDVPNFYYKKIKSKYLNYHNDDEKYT